MAIEKRNIDGSKIKADKKPAETVDWDTDLGGPVMKTPDQKEPETAQSTSPPDAPKSNDPPKTKPKKAQTPEKAQTPGDSGDGSD